MSGFTTYFVQKIVGHVFCGQSWTPPTTYYVKLHVADPSDSGLSNPSVVTTRVAATLSTPDVNGLTIVTADLTWAMTAREAISHVSGWDASTGGNCCWRKQLDAATNVYSGDTFDLSSFGLQIAAGVDASEGS